MTRLEILRESWWHLHRFGYLGTIDTGLAWFYTSALWFAALIAGGWTRFAAGLAALYLGEITALGFSSVMGRYVSAPSFFDYAFARVLRSPTAPNFRSRTELAWQCAGIWLNRQITGQFRESFLLKTVLEDQTIPKEERPASARSMLWATVMELLERGSDDSPPWNKATSLVTHLRKAFRSVRIDQDFRSNLTAAYGDVSKSYRMKAGDPTAGRPVSFATSHPIVTVAFISLVSALIGIIPALMRVG